MNPASRTFLLVVSLSLPSALPAQVPSAQDGQKAVSVLGLAEAALAQGDAAQAVNLFTDAGVWSPGLWQAPYGLGRCYIALGDEPRAAQAWQKGLDLFPGNPALSKALEILRRRRPDLASPGEAAPPDLSERGGPAEPGGSAPGLPPEPAAKRRRGSRAPASFRVEPWILSRIGTLPGGLFQLDKEAALARLSRPAPDGQPYGSGSYDLPGSVFTGSLRLSLMAAESEGGRFGIDLGPQLDRAAGFGWEERSSVVIPDINDQDREDLFRETLFQTGSLYYPLGSYRVDGVVDDQRSLSFTGFCLGPRYARRLGRSEIQAALPLEALWAKYQDKITASLSVESLGGAASFSSESTVRAFGLALAPELSWDLELSRFRFRFSAGWRFLRLGPFKGRRKRTYVSNMYTDPFFDQADVTLVMAPNGDGNEELRCLPQADLDPRGSVETARLNLGGFRAGLELGMGFR